MHGYSVDATGESKKGLAGFSLGFFGSEQQTQSYTPNSTFGNESPSDIAKARYTLNKNHGNVPIVGCGFNS